MIFHKYLSMKWSKESMCCLTSPRTLRKAGTRCHLSSLNKHTSFPHVNFDLKHHFDSNPNSPASLLAPPGLLPPRPCPGLPRWPWRWSPSWTRSRTRRSLTSFLHFRDVCFCLRQIRFRWLESLVGASPNLLLNSHHQCSFEWARKMKKKFGRSLNWEKRDGWKKLEIDSPHHYKE